MPVSVVKPVVGASNGVWGQLLNGALDSVVTFANAQETARLAAEAALTASITAILSF